MDAESLALHIQAVIQGAFILAKATGDPQVAADRLDHLRRYLTLLFEPERKGGIAMSYVDGFVAAVPTANREAYRKHAEEALAVFKEYGALRCVECWGDDVPEGKVTSVPDGGASARTTRRWSSPGSSGRRRRCATPAWRR